MKHLKKIFLFALCAQAYTAQAAGLQDLTTALEKLVGTAETVSKFIGELRQKNTQLENFSKELSTNLENEQKTNLETNRTLENLKAEKSQVDQEIEKITNEKNQLADETQKTFTEISNEVQKINKINELLGSAMGGEVVEETDEVEKEGNSTSTTTVSEEV